jgi:tetratricopeptide (TPR) repeat protein
MRLKNLFSTLGLLGIGLSAAVAWSEPAQAPANVKVEPATPKSAKLTTRAASAEMGGDPQAALKLAQRAIAADQGNPWGYYDKGSALARLGQTDEALLAFSAAEQRYALSDQWGRSIAIYGRAHALGEARRCDEARREFARYAGLIRERDAKSADLAMRYATDCKSPFEAPVAGRR